MLWAAMEFLQIQYLNTIIRNPDYHKLNHGVIRDVKMGVKDYAVFYNDASS